jgi:adenylosuccinate synthase
MGKSIVVLGAQWGDEGKGKIIDLLTDRAAAVIRFQGGHNAGHTLYTEEGKKIVLRLVPSGIMRAGVACFIGNGVVFSPDAFLNEVSELASNGITIEGRLKISPACSLLLPYHVAIDEAREMSRGANAIGTTKRGIGPAYEDKVARRGVRIVDLFSPETLREKLEYLADYHNFFLTQYFHLPAIPVTQVYDSLLSMAPNITPLVEDIALLLKKFHDRGENLIFEGAQGALLDIDFGTYPYVTSSNTTAGAAATGSGFGPLHLNEVYGVCKTYVTRVGGGPFPTELKDEIGEYIAKQGNEFGSVTRRPRRCGWFDVVQMRQSAMINSLSGLILTKLDVLDDLKEVLICTGYRYQNQILDYPPFDTKILSECEPVYEVMAGWQSKTEGITHYEALPLRAREYLAKLESLVGLPISLISTGPNRHDIIKLRNLL